LPLEDLWPTTFNHGSPTKSARRCTLMYVTGGGASCRGAVGPREVEPRISKFIKGRGSGALCRVHRPTKSRSVFIRNPISDYGQNIRFDRYVDYADAWTHSFWPSPYQGLQGSRHRADAQPSPNCLNQRTDQNRGSRPGTSSANTPERLRNAGVKSPLSSLFPVLAARRAQNGRQ